uniref:Uncharacterized protein n=1 Tax=Mus spicilegus TaxID=10103 RepID=A0A8C6I5F6_MUSSI
MSLKIHVLKAEEPGSQWVPVCSQLVSVSPTQRQWSSSGSRRISLECVWGQNRLLERTQRRVGNTTSKLPTTQDFPQPVEEKVGPFTKVTEAMGFTGPLKYSKWNIKIKTGCPLTSTCVSMHIHT